MAPKATGYVFKKGPSYFARVRVPPDKRPAIKLPTCSNDRQAEARKDLLVSLIAQLTEAGREDFIATAIEKAATLPDERLPTLRKLVDGYCKGTERREGEAPLAGTMTLETFARKWTSGELARDFPDHVKVKRSVDQDVYRFEKHIYPVVGTVPLERFRLEDAEAVMRALPPELSPASRRHMAQLLSRLMRMAHYPCRLIERNPLPPGFLPKPGARKMFVYLYPAEDAKLLGCTEVPLVRRVLYGVLDREGMRREDGVSLKWSALDLVRGAVTLEDHKTADHDGARAWALDPSTAEALRRWRKLCPKGELVFPDQDGKPLYVDHLAQQLRDDLLAAGVTRRELHHASKGRMHMRAHDLRATFVTLSLANGKTEAWVMDRTGHTTSVMLGKYRRAARSAEELTLGWLHPMAEAIPELAKVGGKAGPSGSKGPGAGNGTSRGGASGREDTPKAPAKRPVVSRGKHRSAFRFQRRKAWGFESPLVHKAAESGGFEAAGTDEREAPVAQSGVRSPTDTATSAASPLRRALELAVLEATQAGRFDVARALIAQLEALAEGNTAAEDSDGTGQKGVA
jgi:integrase